jgi:hypothetical protein
MSKVVQLSLLDLIEKYESEETPEVEPKPKRKSKYDWMHQNDLYTYELADVNKKLPAITVNVMAFTKYVMSLSVWNNPDRMKRVWNQTHRAHSKNWLKAYHNTVQFSKSRDSHRTSGRASNSGFCRIRLGSSLEDALVTIVHELCHVDQDHAPVINGTRRPHDLPFNQMQMKIANKLWGYNVDPVDAGWSVGKGYAPTKDLTLWMRRHIHNPESKVVKLLVRLSK